MVDVGDGDVGAAAAPVETVRGSGAMGLLRIGQYAKSAPIVG
jgi:hypothetical protein